MNTAKRLAQQPLKPDCKKICSLALCAAFLALVLSSGAAIPSAERLLPDDTLLVVTVPDVAKMREIYKASPQRQFWNDAAMKPFRDKFISKWQEELVKPLEHDLDVRFDDYINLPQGQLTFALTQNGWRTGEEQPPGLLLLLDTRDKSSQLKTNLANLRKKWVDAGKPIKTEKIRNIDFSVLPLSSNDIPKTLKKFFPQNPEVQELSSDDQPKKGPPKSELVIGQVESLLIVCNSTKLVEKVVTRLTGGAMPTLGELAPAAKGQSEAPDPFAVPRPEKVVAAMGLAGLKTLAFAFQDSSEGALFQLFIGAPEATRQGIFKILAGEAKESSVPSFVPADAVKFQRWRLDGRKAWATLEKMMGDISPQWLNGLNFILDQANTTAKDKDPGFDIRKNLIDNLGDDLITYEKAARGSTAAQLKSPPSLLLLGSPNADQLAAALKTVLVFLGQQTGAPAEREFLGRKIFSVPLPAFPLPMADVSKPAAPRTLTYAAGGGYVAMSTDPSMVEEYLRSSESQAKALRETSGLVEASQKVTGPGTGLFGYQNQAETMRATFQALKKDSGAATNALGLATLPGAFGLASPEKNFKDWMDFSLLPAFDKVARYFYFTVYGGSASVDGWTLKMFAPLPPQLKGSATH